MNVKKHVSIVGIALILATTCLLIKHFQLKSETKSEKNDPKEILQQVDDFLNRKLKVAQSIQDTIHLPTAVKLPENWRLFRFKNNKIVDWTSVDWVPDSTVAQISKAQLINHKSGWDLCVPFSKKIGQNNIKFILSYPLIRFSKGKFTSINYITPLNNEDFDLSSKKGDFDIFDSKTKITFYGSQFSSSSGWLLTAFGFSILLFAFVYAFFTSGWLSLIVGLFAMLMRYYVFFGQLKLGQNSWKLFDPTIFASSEYLPSLGDLLLHIVSAGMFVLALAKLISNLKLNSTGLKVLYATLGAAALFFAIGMIHDLSASLILNSNISFDVTNLATITFSSFIAALALAVIFALLYVISSSIFNAARANKIKTSHLILGILLGLVFYVIFQMIDANRSLRGLSPGIIFALCCFILFYVEFSFNIIYKYFLFTTLVTLFFTLTEIGSQSDREKEYLNLYASKLITNKDLEAEYMFLKMENELAEEFLQPEDFAAFENKKEAFEKRLRRLYFTGYLDRYNMLVMSFDSLGRNINSSTLYNYDQLNDIYDNSTFSTISNHFYQVKNSQIFNGYLAKFENCNLKGHYGSIFILLEPKFIQSSYEYAQLVQKNKERSVFNIDQYSYAIYYRQDLMHQKGFYSYNLNIDSNLLQPSEGTFKLNGYDHFVSKQADDAYVILSVKSDLLLRTLSTFSFAFILFVFILLLGMAIWFIGWKLILWIAGWKDKSSHTYHQLEDQYNGQIRALGFDQVYLSTRIRASMVGLVFVGLLISIYVTIQFIRINSVSRAETDLMYRIREIANQLQNEVDLDRKLRNTESRQLIINEISNLYKVEVNLYDPKGFLLASSNEGLYQEGILSPLMNARAKEAIFSQNASQLIHKESIRNLENIAGYIPILNNNRDVIAYLNLPYFQRQSELDAEISSYTVTFVNLYFFLILLAIALAYFISKRISKPLQLIRNKMSITNLDSKTELIDWKQNDEIGRLVQQYNKMVLQLSESAQKLSASEREGAWKEMARQVAHEIKNPLTPMKLNIQHLQRAWADGSDKLEGTFKRVTHVLIQQIDSLSKLASEFSSFAQMPVNNYEKVALTQVLSDTITLFERSENIQFVYNSNWDQAFVKADKDQVGRAFNNVIKNAIQAIPEERKGKISVALAIDEVNKSVTSYH